MDSYWNSAGIHLGIITLIDVFRKANNSHIENEYILIGALVGMVFSVLGGLITCRHERVKKIKIKHIARAEYFLDLIRFEEAGKKSKNDDGTEDNQYDRDPKIIWFEKGEKDLWTDISWAGLSMPRPLSTSGLILSLYVFLILVDIGFLLHKINS